MLSDHDVDSKDAEYYEERINEGGIFVSVDTRLAEGTSETARASLRAVWRSQRASPRALAG